MMFHEQATQENSRLSTLNFITGVGDWLSFFAMMSRTESLGHSGIESGFSVPIKAAAIALGAAFLPKSIAHLSSKGGIILSQILSLALSIAILVLVMTNHFSLEIFFVIAVLQTILKQVFDGCRETHSKNLVAAEGHRALQAQIGFSIYSALFLAPIFVFALIKWTPLWVPFALDTLSFVASTVLAFTLSPGKTGEKPSNIFKPLYSYLWAPGRARLRRVFLQRTFGLWTGLSLLNYLVFEVVEKNFGKDVSFTAIYYTAGGFGAAISTYFLKERFQKLHQRWGDGTLSLIGCFGFGAMGLSYVLTHSFTAIVVVRVFAGIGMGLNAVASQTVRREETSSSEFPEIVGLETFIAQLFLAFGFCAFAKWTIEMDYIGTNAWIYFASAALFMNGFYSLSLNREKLTNSFGRANSVV